MLNKLPVAGPIVRGAVASGGGVVGSKSTGGGGDSGPAQPVHSTTNARAAARGVEVNVDKTDMAVAFAVA